MKETSKIHKNLGFAGNIWVDSCACLLYGVMNAIYFYSYDTFYGTYHFPIIYFAYKTNW